MIFLVGGLMILVAFLLAYIFYMKREMLNIAEQLNNYNDFKTEKKIDVNLINKEIENLAESINRHIEIASELRLNEIKSKEELKEMIANISHDLRTPLTSIVGYIQMLRNRCKDDAKYIEYLTRVENKAKDLEAMLEEFFTLSIINSYEYKINLQYLKIDDILCDTLINFYEPLYNRGIEPKIEIQDVGKVIGDKQSIIRVIENLISNVLKYSNNDLEIKLFESENSIKLVVMNSLAINKKIDTEKMFDKFYKIDDKSRAAKSTGLGLSIVRMLMEKMDGTVDAEQTGNKLYVICRWKIG